MKTVKESLAARLCQLREAAGYSQTELAEAAGLVPSALSLLEAGKRQPSFETICKLAAALKVSTDVFR